MTTAYVAFEALDFAAELLESIYDAGERGRTYYETHLKEHLHNIDWIAVARSVAEGLAVAVLMAYEAGRLTGTVVYRASDYLGSVHKGLIAPEVAPEVAPEPTLELEYLTCKQLREMLGGYKPKATKKQLLAMAYDLTAT